MVIIQGHAQGLGHRIQLKPVQIWQKNPGETNGVHDRRPAFHPLPQAVFLDKTHIEICVVGHHYTALAEFHKLRQNLLDGWRIDHHGIINGSKLLDTEGNWNFRVDKGRKSICNFPLLYLHCSDLDDSVALRTKARGLQVKHHIIPV